jgi:amino acid transporter
MHDSLGPLPLVRGPADPVPSRLGSTRERGGSTIESASVSEHHPLHPSVGAQQGEKGLKKNAIGYISNVVIGVASTAPGYSLAATLGFVVAVAGVGLQAPAVMLISFIPMFCIAYAYRSLNGGDPDCGTTFAWVTRGLGPSSGWLGGWGIIAADVIVMATLAQIAAIYTFLLFGWDSYTTFAVIVAGVVWIAVMTLICFIGIELSARTQMFLLGAEIIALALFAVWALAKVYIDDPTGSLHVSASWFNPFAIDSWGAMVDGVLLGVFIYWGWDSGVAVNEESEDSARGPGKAAVVSTLLLLGIYLVVSAAAQAYGGPQLLIDNSDDVLSVLGDKVFPGPMDKILIIAVLTSAAASTQTTILPTARTSLSMARWKAIPAVFGRVHPRYLTPSVSTVVMGVVSILWFVGVVSISENVLGDSITGLGFAIAFYYGITGFACVWYYRRVLFRNLKSFVSAGLLPLAGALMLTGIFIKALIDYSKEDAGYSPAVAGIGSPVVIGIGMLLLGVVLLVISRFVYRDFFRRKREVATEPLE